MKRYIILVCALLTIAGIAAYTDRGHAEQRATGKAAKAAGMEPKQGYYGTIRFYEGNNASQHSFCPITITQRPAHIIQKMGDCNKNDEARSLRFESTPPAVIVKVYDSPSCDTSDDWTEIRTLVVAAPAYLTVGTFETN